MFLSVYVLVINYILVVSLWYFLFAWVFIKTDYKRFRDIINNFLWVKFVDSLKFYSKVVWSLVIQKRIDGGLGLVDSMRKVIILYGQWVLKVFLSSLFFWKNFVLLKLDSVSTVINGVANRYMFFVRKFKF